MCWMNAITSTMQGVHLIDSNRSKPAGMIHLPLANPGCQNRFRTETRSDDGSALHVQIGGRSLEKTSGSCCKLKPESEQWANECKPPFILQPLSQGLPWASAKRLLELHDLHAPKQPAPASLPLAGCSPGTCVTDRNLSPEARPNVSPRLELEGNFG